MYRHFDSAEVNRLEFLREPSFVPDAKTADDADIDFDALIDLDSRSRVSIPNTSAVASIDTSGTFTDLTMDVAKQEALANAFDEFLDPDANGDVDVDEWQQGLQRLGVPLSDPQKRRLFSLMDIDRSRSVCKDAFLFIMTGHCENEELNALKEPLWRAVRMKCQRDIQEMSAVVTHSMVLTDEQILSVTNFICATDPTPEPSKSTMAVHHDDGDGVVLGLSGFQCTHSIEEKEDGPLQAQMEQLRMELEVQEELAQQSDQRAQEAEEALQSAQDTIFRKDKALWAWNGVERELRKQDLRSLQDLESKMIRSLQTVRRVIARKTEQEHECKVCMDRRKDTVLVPCGHCLCSTCCVRVQKCPMCRAEIDRTVQLR